MRIIAGAVVVCGLHGLRPHGTDRVYKTISQRASAIVIRGSLVNPPENI
jgi:hypothetical protein